MEIILSTGNDRKADEVRAIFIGSGISVVSLADLHIKDGALEDGQTLRENAVKKALFAREHGPKGLWVMADDTGIFIDELNGNPGVNTAFWPQARPTIGDILAELKGLKSRLATFKTTVALISPAGREFFFEGSLRGKLLDVPRSSHHPRMPYSAIFLPSRFKKTFAEMTIEEENKISHRGQAFRKVRQFLQKNILERRRS